MTWATARRFVLPALKEGSEDDVVDDISRGLAMLWEGERSAMVTQFTHSPRTIHVWLGGGDLADLLRLMPGVEAYGRAMGCVWITGEGRKGWQRALKPFGYARDGAELRKAL